MNLVEPGEQGSAASIDRPLATRDGVQDEGLFSGESEIAALMRQVDWAATSLGPVANWSQSLRTVVRILLTSRYAMWVGWGPDLTFLYNETYARVSLGKKHPWALGKSAPLVWREIWDDISPRVQQVLEGGTATWDEALLLFLERSGYREETYHTFSYSPLSDDGGRIAGMLCVVMEETERVIGERRLRLLRSLASGLSGAITEVDVLRKIGISLGQNQRDLPFTLTYVLAENGTARLACASGIDPGHPAAPVEIDLARQDSPWGVAGNLSGETPTTVIDLTTRFGSLPPGDWDRPPQSAVLLPLQKQGQDSPAGFFIAALNPYRQLDTEYSGFLGLIAGQIAAGIANAHAYEQERRRAEALAELDRAKTIFFSNVSHEFRTPLTLMLGPLEDLLNSAAGSLSAGDQHQIETVRRNGLRLLKLVNTLLDFSRIEAGRIQAVYRPVDLGARTAELASVFRSAMDRAGLQYRIECESLDEAVYVDIDMWEKIVLNLLSNAFKFTLRGGVEVTLREVRGQAELSVSDTGTGIPESELPRVFERFHRIEGAAGRTHEGTGIGLALVDELVRLHGGSVSAESILGKGTKFRVRIPFGAAHLAADRVAAESLAAENTLGAAPFVQEALRWLPDGADAAEQGLQDLANEGISSLLAEDREASPSDGGRVLLADDNRDMREYVERLLGRRFRVTVVADGEEALAAALENPPDLVLTDVMMPRMDGFGLLRALRGHPATATLPVIMLSARAGEEAESGGLEAGADDYLVKPFTARELIARVSSHIAMHRLRRELTAKEHQLRTKAENAERQYRDILESISEGFLFVDRNWIIRYANQQAAALGSFALAEIVGRRLWDAFPEQIGAKLGDVCRRAMQTGEVMRVEEFYHKSERWVHANIYPSAEGLSLFVHDVTERRLQQQKLLLSEKLAATGRLAATIAHEINNPLESVLNLVYLARTSQAPAAVTSEYLTTAEKELTRVAHIARHTLGFYRETSVASDIDVSALLEEVLTVYDSRLRASAVEVRREFTIVPAVRALRGELHQVFSNLISNAIDAMRQGGTLRIGIRVSEAGQPAGVVVSIQDTGEGIPPQNLPRLFEPFFTTKPSAGTGLGLWVVRQFVTAWGGSVHIDSHIAGPDRGTRFTIAIPLHAVADGQKNPEAPSRVM